MRGIQGGGGVANESDLVSQMSPLPSVNSKTECEEFCLKTSKLGLSEGESHFVFAAGLVQMQHAGLLRVTRVWQTADYCRFNTTTQPRMMISLE